MHLTLGVKASCPFLPSVVSVRYLVPVLRKWLTAFLLFLDICSHGDTSAVLTRWTPQQVPWLMYTACAEHRPGLRSLFPAVVPLGS